VQRPLQRHESASYRRFSTVDTVGAECLSDVGASNEFPIARRTRGQADEDFIQMKSNQNTANAIKTSIPSDVVSYAMRSVSKEVELCRFDSRYDSRAPSNRYFKHTLPCSLDKYSIDVSERETQSAILNPVTLLTLRSIDNVALHPSKTSYIIYTSLSGPTATRKRRFDTG